MKHHVWLLAVEVADLSNNVRDVVEISDDFEFSKVRRT